MVRLLKNLFRTSILFAFFLSCSLLGQNSEREEYLVHAITRQLENNHYVRQKLNNDLSEDLFERYLEQLDFEKKFFLKSDIEKLEPMKKKLDDQLHDQSLEFFNEVNSLFKARLEQNLNLSTNLLQNAFDFDKDESIELDEKKLDYASDEAALKERLRKLFKYRTLVRLLVLKQQEDKKDEAFEKLEASAREKVLENHLKSIERFESMKREEYLSIYINALCQLFDPHTTFFAPKDNEDFQIDMSGKLEGIGAQLTEDDGYIKVVKIIPGGPAFRQKELEANDLLLKVAQDKDEPVDIVGMPVDEAVHLIRGKKGTDVVLTVKKPDGQIKNIRITRDVVVLEEVFAKSATLKSSEEEKFKAGYIYLPQFYDDFKGDNNFGSAVDVQRNLQYLMQENINGLILDFRNNGGGSLNDAIVISSFFIENGPVLQTQDMNGEKSQYTDRVPGAMYKGPIVVLVNSLSASASEIVAAALQDHGRALIVGDSHTFGKGTVQVMQNLDNMVLRLNRDESLGNMKLTQFKFYRINGGATQNKGVIPDVILPSIWDGREIGERYMDNALPFDTIPAANYSRWPAFDASKVNEVRLNSLKRVQKDEYFQSLVKQAEKTKIRREKTEQSLHFKTAIEEQEKLEKENSEIEKKRQPIKGFVIDEPGNYPKKKDAEEESLRQDRRQAWEEGLQKDVTLYESLEILKDWAE